jgi:predicted DNA-binding ribbon-helix-helix protein
MFSNRRENRLRRDAPAGVAAGYRTHIFICEVFRERFSVIGRGDARFDQSQTPPHNPAHKNKTGGYAMCEVFAGQDPQRYRPVNRSVRIGGHSTSIQLEAAFWDLIDEIAAGQNFSTSRFLSTLYDEALDINGSVPNFASLLRTSCLIYLMGGAGKGAEPRQFHIVAAE